MRFTLALVAFGAAVVGALPGIEIVDVDEMMGAKGVFSGMKLAVPTIGVNSVSQAVNKFNSVLSVPGVLDSTYNSFTAKFNKGSDDENEEERKEVFKSNILDVFAHNMNAKSGHESFTMGVNQFSDLTLDEVRAKYTGAQLPNVTDTEMFESVTPTKTPFGRVSKRQASAERDWRNYGIITPVKDQGQCGSCTDFAVTGGLEAAMALYKGVKNLDLSEQELVDCPTGGGVGRCSGNWPEPIYDYQKSQGQVSEGNYPYQAKELGSCRRTNSMSQQAKVSNYYRTSKGDENQLKEWVYTYGAHSVVIEVNDAFQNYKSGVMDSPCSNTRYDHSVLLVGYGSENGKDYWLVKNSWNTWWGDKGYIKMARNKNNLCLIADYAILPQA